MKIGYLWKTCLLSDAKAIAEMLEGELVEMDGEQDLDKIDLFVLFGGEDISPAFYDEKPVKANANAKPSPRDLLETITFLGAQEAGIPVLAICRGAQLACVLLDGKLWQHVDHHDDGPHTLIMDGVAYKTNSYHHQMMRPTPDMEVLAYSPCLSKTKWDETRHDNQTEDEPEIVFMDKPRVLMVQGHPEWQTKKDDLYQITQRLVRKLLCPIS